jgi:tRNA threonylcarbamoyladenosine biosynthesis protein TsaE
MAVTVPTFPSTILWKKLGSQSAFMPAKHSDSLSVDCCHEAATDQLGACIAASVVDGIVVELNGQLGAGKTRLVRAICAALDIDITRVNSPTFVLLQLYTDGRVPVAHFDTYRLSDTDEFMAIGANEFTNSHEWLCLIEWADRVAMCLPDDRLRIDISATSAHARHFVLSSTGSISGALLQRIRQNNDQSHG